MIESVSERPAFLPSGLSVHINDVTSPTVWSEQLQFCVINIYSVNDHPKHV